MKDEKEIENMVEYKIDIPGLVVAFGVLLIW